jgi:ferredoxin
VSVITPDFHSSRCVRYRFRYSECKRCVDVCPHEAIALGEEGVTLDAGKCRNCALCTSACRTAALTSGNLPRVDLLKRAIKETRFSFACAPSGAVGDAVVPCLGAIDAAVLAYLGKRGVEIELRGAGHCRSCEHAPQGPQLLAANSAARDALEDACEGETWAALIVVDGDSASAPEDFRAGRRQLFRRLIGRGVDEAVKAVTLPPIDIPIPDKAIRPGPWHVPQMRELLEIVCRRAEHEPCLVPPQAALPLAQMRLARGCTNCEACIRACPTGALQVRESEAEWTFLFLADRCVGCGVCSEVCQPRVLRPNEEIIDATPEEDIALNILAKQRCNRCDRFFVSPEPAQTCPICVDDDAAFGRIFG